MRSSIGLTTVTDNAMLEVCKGDHLVTITYNRGDVLLFRGDTAHAGAASATGHFGRIHCYIDSLNVYYAFDSTDIRTCAQSVPLRRNAKRTRTKQLEV